jgi:2-succinyl-6-hydroxy-2,4-cyclohexadiene-1-carboxylate synthase
VVKLVATTWGRGRVPALLLHGFTGSRHSFDHLQGALKGTLSATCVDLPGHRKAPLPRRSGTEGFLETVDSLARLLRRPTVVVGYSQGARLALALAVRHPARVRALVLESVNPGLRRERDRAARRRSDEARAEALLADGVEAFVARWERMPIFEGLRALSPAARQALRARRTAHGAQGLAGALRCLGQGVQPDLWPSLPDLDIPTLLLCGSRDVRYARLARRIAALLPRARRVCFPGATHAPHLERPRDWAEAVRAFLQGELG